MKNRMKLISLALFGAFVTPALAVTNDEIEEMQTQLKRMQVKLEALEDGRAASGLEGIKVTGMMDPTYIYNQRRDSAGFNFLSNFDARDSNQSFAYDNSFFGLAMLQIDKEMESGTKWKLVLAPHKSTGSAFNLSSIVHEANVSVPLTDLQTRMIAGQFADWSGYEYYFSHQQKLITHNMLFDFAAPNFYQGAGVELTSGKWIVKTLLANMNQVSHDDHETDPILTYRVDYAKGEFDGFGFAGQHGKYLGSRIDMFELDAYFTRGDLALYGQVGAGKWKDHAFNGGDAKWAGVSLLGAYKITPRFEVALRGDYVKNDKNGGGTIATVFTGCDDGATPANALSCTDPAVVGVGAGDSRNGFGPTQQDLNDALANGTPGVVKGADRTAVSLGASYAVNANTTLKFEYRVDRANKETFLDVKTGNFEKTNSLIASSVVVSF